MRLDIRYYKRYDYDLIALYNAGYPLREYLLKALSAYAHAKPFHIFLPEPLERGCGDMQGLHSSYTIEDEKSIELLKQVKPNYRNYFCKLLLRDALIGQNLACLCTKPEFFELEQERINQLKETLPEGTIIAKPKRKRRTVEELLKKTPSPVKPSPTPKKKAGVRKTEQEEEELQKKETDTEPVAVDAPPVLDRETDEWDMLAAKFGGQTTTTEQKEPLPPVTEQRNSFNATFKSMLG